MRHKNNSKETATKIDPVCGFLEARYVTCGKPNCKYAKGQLHGPYFCRRWIAAGNRRSKYVRKAAIADVKESISAFKQERESRRGQRKQGGELLSLLRLIRRQQQDIFKSMSNGGL